MSINALVSTQYLKLDRPLSADCAPPKVPRCAASIERALQDIQRRRFRLRGRSCMRRVRFGRMAAQHAAALDVRKEDVRISWGVLIVRIRFSLAHRTHAWFDQA